MIARSSDPGRGERRKASPSEYCRGGFLPSGTLQHLLPPLALFSHPKNAVKPLQYRPGPPLSRASAVAVAEMLGCRSWKESKYLKALNGRIVPQTIAGRPCCFLDRAVMRWDPVIALCIDYPEIGAVAVRA